MSVSIFFNSFSFSLVYFILAVTFFRNAPRWRYLLCFLLLSFVSFASFLGNYVSLLNIPVYILCFFSRKNWKNVLFSSIKVASLSWWGNLFFYSLFTLCFPAHDGTLAFHIFMRCFFLFFALFFLFGYRSFVKTMNRYPKIHQFILDSTLLLFYVLVLPRIQGQSTREAAFILFAVLTVIAILIFLLNKGNQAMLEKQRQSLEKLHCQRLSTQMAQDLEGHQKHSLPKKWLDEINILPSTLLRLQLKSFLHHAVVKNRYDISLLVDDVITFNDDVIYPLYLILHEFFHIAFSEFHQLDIGKVAITFTVDSMKENISICVRNDVITKETKFNAFCNKKNYTASLEHLSKNLPVESKIRREFRNRNMGNPYLHQEITFAI